MWAGGRTGPGRTEEEEGCSSPPSLPLSLVEKKEKKKSFLFPPLFLFFFFRSQSPALMKALRLPGATELKEEGRERGTREVLHAFLAWSSSSSSFSPVGYCWQLPPPPLPWCRRICIVAVAVAGEIQFPLLTKDLAQRVVWERSPERRRRRRRRGRWVGGRERGSHSHLERREGGRKEGGGDSQKHFESGEKGEVTSQRHVTKGREGRGGREACHLLSHCANTHTFCCST